MPANELCSRNRKIYRAASEYERYYDRNKQLASERGERAPAYKTRLHTL